MKMTKTVLLLLTLSVLSMLAPSLKAQDSPKSPDDAQQKPVNAYRLNFSMNEFDNGKKINTRVYSLNLNAGDGDEVKIGTRVPVEAKQGEFQYIDVGTSIWCSIKEISPGLLLLKVRSDFSNFATPDQQSRTTMPLLRQFTIHGSTVSIPGKPTVIGSVDDPNSSHEFQLEVVATKL